MSILEALGRPRVAATLLLFLTALQLFYNAQLPLYGDEAYYWVWSQHLNLSYFDHPPMIAWLLALATQLGTNELTVRIVSAVCIGLSTWFVYKLTFDIYGPIAAAIALIMFAALPATQLGALLTTPDAPVTLFWSVALYASYCAVFRETRSWYVGAGVAIGLALLSKYTAILFPVSLFVFLMIRRRDLLLHGRAWMAVLLAVAVFAPVLIWNYSHDWISFAFQYQHGSSQTPELHWGLWFEFMAGCFIAFTPVFLVVALIAAASRTTWRNDRRVFVAIFFLLPLAFFLYKGLFKKMELNWVTVAFPAATVLAAGFIAERRYWRTLAGGLMLALTLSLAVKFPGALGLSGKMNIQNRLVGYQEAVKALLMHRRPGEPLLADHYSRASLLSFYAPDHPLVRIPTVTRFSQYDLWSLAEPETQPKGLYLSASERKAELESVCGRASLLQVFTFKRPDFTPKTFYFYRCGM